MATLSELGVGTRLSVTAPRTGADGKTKDAGFLLFRPNEKTVLAYTAICTHQGCAVTTKAPQGEDFYCPCHGSYFQPSDGKAIAGPARGALERIAASDQGPGRADLRLGPHPPMRGIGCRYGFPRA